MRNKLLGAILVAMGACTRTGLAAPVVAAPGSDIGREADQTQALPDLDLDLRLRRSDRLIPLPLGVVTGDLPVFLRSDTMSGFVHGTIQATGDAELRQRGMVVLADELRYNVPDERCVAEGHVEIHRGADLLTGPKAEFDMHDQSGQVEEPVLTFAAVPGRNRAARATASLAVFPDTTHEHLEQAQYTTCVAGSDDWYLTGSTVDLDRTTQIGEARNARIIFEGVPLLYSPYMSFPLNDQRKSGFLSPTIGTTGTNGVDISIPYYFNLAPNYDDTLTPRLLSKRGVQLADEFRYLEPTYKGVLNAELLDRDVLAGERRYFLSALHDQALPGGVNLHVNAQEVSDSAYFRDLSTTVTSTSTTYLPRDFGLGYGLDGWGFGVRALSYQTIRDPSIPVGDQYRMRPQLTANYLGDLPWADVTMQNEFTDFRHPTLVQGQRYISYPSISVPFTNDWGYVTPKLGYNFTAYQLDAQTAAGIPSQRLTRSLPIASLDSGLYFDRPVELYGKDMVQTLEPRLFYLNIPPRNQSALPLFNTGLAQFSYSQLFAENQYNGPDRINDADQLTAAVQTRLLDPETGVEAIRALVGQRFYYRAQSVVIPGELARTANVSDFLAAVSGRIDKSTQGDFAWDYNPTLHRTENFGTTLHYRPEAGKVLNLGYRINRDTIGQPDIRQIDLSAEWPIGGHWSAVVRVNYDTAQSILVEGLAGAEYTSGCWAFRIVTHRLAVSTVQSTSALFIQLELNGLVHLGTNPLEALRLNIPGYSKTNEIPR